jgi:hypothetical protein
MVVVHLTMGSMNHQDHAKVMSPVPEGFIVISILGTGKIHCFLDPWRKSQYGKKKKKKPRN